MIVTFDTSPLKNIEKHQQKQNRSRIAAVVKPIRFYPPPPPVLPDLNTNYLFNEERAIAGNLAEQGAGGQQEAAVNIKDVFYVGSVITGESRKGIVSYPGSKTPAPAPTTRTRGRRVPTVTSAESAMEQTFLSPGDSFGGYKVTEVEADRIVFKKGAEVIEKMLNDPDKKRKTVTPQPPRANSASRVTTISPTASPPTAPSRNGIPRATPTTQRLRQTRPTVQSRQQARPGRTPRAVRMTPEQIRQMEREIDQAERQKR